MNPEQVDALAIEAAERSDPLLSLWIRGQRDASEDLRLEAIQTYAFAVTTRQALNVVAANSPGGLVDMGAGLGWWARRLTEERGLDVIAFDVAPPPHSSNPWYKLELPHYEVSLGDASMAAEHADRALLLMWPMCTNEMGHEIAEAYTRAGGEQIIYCGERLGGWTGTANLFSLFDAAWAVVDTCELPCWPGLNDRLVIYNRQ